MGQEEFLYKHNSIAITGVLFLLIILFNEIGFRMGRFVQANTDDEVKSLTGSIQGSILGLLALLLGFTFSMSMQRFDQRSHALIDEANAIGTALLRVQLLPMQYQGDAEKLIKQYIDLRVEVTHIDLTKHEARKAYNNKVSALQNKLWALSILAANEDPRAVTTGAFLNALTEVIDSQGKRNAILQMHVPEVVLILLFIVFIASGGILGYSSGLSGKRIVAPAILVSFLIALIVFIIIDLDRPKRGLIQVNKQILLELQEGSF